ncbi:MAG: hypothetical protein ACXADC_04955 [Candidatus Thorarchaeota archaeon]|jgi:hypothetical protein
MTYRHKKTICSKKTREILEKYTSQGDKKYASVQFASAVNVESVEKVEEEDGPEADNVLADEVDCMDQEIQLPPMPVNEMEGLEDYTPMEEPTFEVEETKEEMEKKRKKRNYVEFRDDYE